MTLTRRFGAVDFDKGMNLQKQDILRWLRTEDPRELEGLWQAADAVRKQSVGDAVHLRGLLEISNHCARQCGYCGLNAGNRGLVRYRMSWEEILVCVETAVQYGYGTVVMQAGEDYGIARDWLADRQADQAGNGPGRHAEHGRASNRGPASVAASWRRQVPPAIRNVLAFPLRAGASGGRGTATGTHPLAQNPERFGL